MILYFVVERGSIGSIGLERYVRDESRGAGEGVVRHRASDRAQAILQFEIGCGEGRLFHFLAKGGGHQGG